MSVIGKGLLARISQSGDFPPRFAHSAQLHFVALSYPDGVLSGNKEKKQKRKAAKFYMGNDQEAATAGARSFRGVQSHSIAVIHDGLRCAAFRAQIANALDNKR